MICDFAQTRFLLSLFEHYVFNTSPLTKVLTEFWKFPFTEVLFQIELDTCLNLILKQQFDFFLINKLQDFFCTYYTTTHGLSK